MGLDNLSVPLRLIYKPFFHSPLFQILNEISISTSCSTTASPPCARSGAIRMAVRWWWIVCWAGLKSNWCIGIKMTRDSLNRWGNSTLLLIHCRSALSSSSCCGLCIEVLLWSILPNRNLPWDSMHYAYLVAICSRLRRIRRRCTLLIWKHIVVDWRRLT